MYARARDIRVGLADAIDAPAVVTVSQGIAKSLVTASGAYEPALTPYMTEPCDALGSRRYRSVVFVGPGRSGKTVSLIDGWAAHNVVNAPGDMLVVQASQDLARYYSKKRMKRVIEASKDLRERLSPLRQDDNTYDKAFRSGMTLSFGWPSGAQLSGRDYKYVALTEYDLADDDIDGEGSLSALASKRVETFLSAGKVAIESSVRREYRIPDWRAPAGSPHLAPPATGITALYNTGTRKWLYWRCRSCGAWMALHPDIHMMFDLPPLRDLVEILADIDPYHWARERAFIACRGCGEQIHESSKRALNLGARWVPDGCSIHGDGEIVGAARQTDCDSYQLSAVAAAYQTWPKLLEKYAVAIQSYRQTGSEVEIKSTVNLDQGRVYLPLSAGEAQSGHALQDRAEDWPEQTVPHGVRFLTAQVDIQAGKRPKFVIQVHGWGVGLEWWVIDRFALKSSARPTGKTNADGTPEMHPLDPAAYPEDWDRLIEKVIDRRYVTVDGRTMPLRLVTCDSGGKAGVTANAYKFWRRLKARGMQHRLRLVKGASTASAPRVHETFPDTRKRSDRTAGSAGDVPVLILNTDLLKDVIAANLARSTPGPGYAHFAKWLPTSFFDELTAETRTASGWANEAKRRNESIDLAVYGLAAAIKLGGERIDWTNPPAWAAEWDKNPDVRRPEEPIPIFARRQRRVVHSNYLRR